jgi:peptidoglycan-N-acetylmuramic acid deacetylase
MKTLFRVMPLTVFVSFLLAIRIGGCQIFPALPSESGGLTPTPIASSTEPSKPSETGSSNQTSAATAVSPETAGTSRPSETTVLPTATVPLSGNNQSLGWSFIYADPAGQDLPTNIPDSVRKMVERYKVLWQLPPSDRKVVYLTMDNGYEFNNYTARILDTAKLKGVPITFFIIGSYLTNNEDLVIRMSEEGHSVANHSYTHPDTVKMLDEKGVDAVLTDMHRLETAYKDLTGQDMSKLYRPPSGIYSERLLDLLSREGYTTVFWSFAYRDWLTDDQPDPAEAKARILGQLHNGSIILLHAVSKTNTELLPDLIDEIRARGYEFASLDEIP